MDAGVQCNKEMVDLLMRMKKHLKAHHQVSLNMSDPDVMTNLLKLATVKDDVLQGMMQYLMALAGGDWNRRYLVAANKAKSGAAGKGFAERFRDKMLEGTSADASVASAATPPPGQAAKVRYYRGQPVYG